MHVLGFALAAVIGLSLGLMGGGGSILTVPVLVYVFGFGPKTAIAMSLPIVGVTSLVGALGHWRAGNVRLRTAALFGIVAMAGSFTGARAASYVQGATQLVLLAVVMLAAATAMLRGSVRPRTASQPRTADGLTATPPNDRPMPDGSATARPMPDGTTMVPAAPPAVPVSWRLLAAALAVGVLTGIVGIGGGFLIVPALVVLGDVPMKHAIGTSLLVIAMNSASGFAGYLGDVAIPWGVLAVFTAVAIGGIVLGTWLVRFVSATSLKRGFAVFLLVIGAFVLYQNRAVLSWRRQPHVPQPAAAIREVFPSTISLPVTT